ncbi:MAG: prolipoprotein diacylglyceryl transferase, partial [Clostridia bacterium]|nr:prolipoprotein diacylglyceryl transferase [Clostridia bacterium]
MIGFLNSAIAFSLGPLTVRWYGIILCLGMALGIILALREARRQHQDEEHLLNMLLLIIPLAVLGARLYYVLFNLNWYLAHPADILASWKGGLAIHGAVIAGVLVLIIYCRVKKTDFFRWADILAPSLILGQAIGRWGNFANQEAYGPVIADGSFWSWMPLQVYADGAYHHPTFLYESAGDLALFIFLIVLIRRPHRVGAVFAWYLIFYSVLR